MHGKISQFVKRLVTLCTLIWLSTCVSTEVPSQMEQRDKRLVTLCTLIWLFTCVSTEVRGQTPPIGETPRYIVFTDMAFHLCEFRGAWLDELVG